MGSRVLAFVADSGPVLVLAVIAAAGSFTHIRDTAEEHGQHGWMAWAIAVCIDLTCVMAAGERQRDARTGRDVGPFSWPNLVLFGGILLSLGANLAQAEPTAWGWITAGTPAGAFLVAVSMLERRAGARPVQDEAGETVPAPSSASPEQDEPSSRPALDPGPGQTEDSRPSSEPDVPASGPAPQLLSFARRVADEHASAHGKPITRDALRARLGVSSQLASDLLRLVRTS
ncbi:uncharacterized protein DUF2637 [Actinocorallia herbida]|uniref:Uncharacterized protein DUF2637 n=1 Tax=Actinocorallia herbida TaxID=58109 RepID=A0A3N1DCP1_9ACTN|nr:DUF2637 domain-containing protein [Actinocorallia herbida]ROO90898.1 uncharacterized protein DUF2637 [Actinocorallia herbida]